MSEAAMVGEAKGAPGETPEDIDIRRFRRERERECRIRGLTVESGAAEVCAEEKMG